MIELIAPAMEWLASLAVIASAIVWTVTALRMCDTAEKEDCMLLFPSAAGDMARAIRAKQEEERSRKS